MSRLNTYFVRNVLALAFVLHRPFERVLSKGVVSLITIDIKLALLTLCCHIDPHIYGTSLEDALTVWHTFHHGLCEKANKCGSRSLCISHD